MIPSHLFYQIYIFLFSSKMIALHQNVCKTTLILNCNVGKMEGRKDGRNVINDAIISNK